MRSYVQGLCSFATLLLLVLGTLETQVQAATLRTGDLVKSSSSSAVYEVGSDGTRLVFQMQSVYESWYGKDFSSVRTVSQDELASLPVRRVKSFNIGSVVKSPSLPTVYLVTADLELKAIPSETAFHELGKSFAAVRDIPDGFFTSYKIVGTLPDSEKPSPSSTPTSETSPVVLDILSRSFTATSKTTGDVRIETTAPSKVALRYHPMEASANEAVLVQSTGALSQHVFSLKNLSSRSKYAYTLTIADAQGVDRIEESGSFVTYYDLYVSSHGSAPETGSLRVPGVEVGRFFVYNNSKESQHVQEIWLTFDSASNASDGIAKTIEITDVTPGSTQYGTVVTFKNIGAGTSIRNSLQTQRFNFLDIPIQSGAQRIFSVTMKGLENMDIEGMNNEVFTTRIEKLLLAGDPEIYTQSSIIGSRFHILK
jgi:hypothetical protein